MDLDEDLTGSAAGKGPTRGRKFIPVTAMPEPESRDPVAVTKTDNVEDVVNPEPSNGAAKPEEEPAALALNEGDHVEEDVVVRSIDVFNVPSVDSETQLYLTLYPMSPSWRTYELDDRCQERIKPGTSDLEMDLKPIESSNWDALKAWKNNVEKLVCAF